MFPASDELHDILPPSVQDVHRAQSRGLTRQILHTKQYRVTAPITVEETTGTYWNPAVEAYTELLDWQPRTGWYPVDETSVLTYYPAYVPTDTVIEHLVRATPIIEVGAGSGYWSAVVNRNGGDCIATDAHPPDVKPSTTYPVTRAYDTPNDNEYVEIQWDHVLETDHTVVDAYPERDVLLCHPPGQKWPQHLLDHMHPQQRLILVAEWYPGADATPKFFKRLHDNWDLIHKYPVLDWASMNTGFYVFEQRKNSPQHPELNK